MGSGLIKPVHILILVLVVVILFGWKKLPDAARSLGRSMRIFKSEVEEMKKDGKSTPSAASSDTVKGETVHPTGNSTGNSTGDSTADSTADSSSGPISDPTKRAASDPVEHEKHNQSPS